MVRSLQTVKLKKYKTFKVFIPPSKLDSKKVMDDFLAAQKEWEVLMEKIIPFDIDRNKVQSPISSLIK